ncbi:MAG: hypothetical protein Hyperionvirus3_164 [Hyperionvirus sp.]|uniref:Uncharacterized protein n=1 Tax=Hyperionvirus sp. TaxID=2487770 RepID=A0A3G5A764_9VIRU|nr:MAG: hypothetical protein Hyperionvirus3_164 [Hyperionvirus sp.]
MGNKDARDVINLIVGFSRTNKFIIITDSKY